MRKRILYLLAIPFLLWGCERETLTDPVLFCEAYNRAAAHPIREADAYLRTENEFLFFTEGTAVRLVTNEDGAIHTAVVTGSISETTASVAGNAFAVLAKPFTETVPQTVLAQCGEQALCVQTQETKRFFYAVFREGDTVTAVQKNLLLSSIPVQPSLRSVQPPLLPSEPE